MTIGEYVAAEITRLRKPSVAIGDVYEHPALADKDRHKALIAELEASLVGSRSVVRG